MKKMIILVLAAFAAFSVAAQKLDASKVPAAAKNTFAKQHPGVPSTWEKENGKYEVNFKQGENKMSMLIDAKGTVTETETDIKPTELPATVTAYVKEHYKGKTISEAARISKPDGTVTYEAEVAGADLIFDANGKFIKKEKD